MGRPDRCRNRVSSAHDVHRAAARCRRSGASMTSRHNCSGAVRCGSSRTAGAPGHHREMPARGRHRPERRKSATVAFRRHFGSRDQGAHSRGGRSGRARVLRAPRAPGMEGRASRPAPTSASPTSKPLPGSSRCSAALLPPTRWTKGEALLHRRIRRHRSRVTDRGSTHGRTVSLTHTPSPMGFLCDILGRPKDLERPYMLLVVGYPDPRASVPNIQRKPLAAIAEFLPPA